MASCTLSTVAHREGVGIQFYCSRKLLLHFSLSVVGLSWKWQIGMKIGDEMGDGRICWGNLFFQNLDTWREKLITSTSSYTTLLVVLYMRSSIVVILFSQLNPVQLNPGQLIPKPHWDRMSLLSTSSRTLSSSCRCRLSGSGWIYFFCRFYPINLPRTCHHGYTNQQIIFFYVFGVLYYLIKIRFEVLYRRSNKIVLYRVLHIHWPSCSC